MNDERSRRRPVFRPGMGLRLADGQVWSLPVPGEAAGHLRDLEIAWDDPSYRAILRAISEAEDQGQLFRAELALAIHLIEWNYEVDGNDLKALFDVPGEGRLTVDLSEALHELATAHVGSDAGRAEVGNRFNFGMPKEEILRLIRNVASRVAGRRGIREAEGPADLTT